MLPMRWYESFQIANRIQRLNRWMQIALLLTFIGGLNYLAVHHFVRFDLSSQNQNLLSPETRAYLTDLPRPVQIYVTIPPDSPRKEEALLYRYTASLLDEFRYLSRQNQQFLISVQYVDIYKDIARAEELARQHGLDQANAVLVVSGDRRRLLPADELLRFEKGQPVAFTGEAALTAAVVEVTSQQSPVLYFLTGHQETLPEDSHPQNGLSTLADELQLRNFQLRSLDLSQNKTVPSDAAAIILADPRGPLLQSEIERLRSYLRQQNGRLMVWLRPAVQTGLRSLFAEWGLFLPDHQIVEPDPAYRQSSQGLLLRNFSEHPIMRTLIDNQTFLRAEIARPVIPVRPSPPDERLSVEPLFASSESSWSESAYQLQSNHSFDEDSDIPGPVSLAAVASRGAASQLGIKVAGGRLAVFGSPGLFTNQRLPSLGNRTLFFHSLNWLLDRQQRLAIPPRPIQTFQLAASQQQLQALALLFCLVPSAVAFFGLLVHWIRRT